MNTTIQYFAPRECLECYSGLKKIIKVIEEDRLQQNEIIKIRKPGKSHRLSFGGTKNIGDSQKCLLNKSFTSSFMDLLIIIVVVPHGIKYHLLVKYK
jgi:hypothetical protein